MKRFQAATPTPASRAPLDVYLKPEARELLEQRLTAYLGAKATGQQKAELLGLHRSHLWKLMPRKGHEGSRPELVRPNLRLIARIFQLWPDLQFNDLFEVIEHEDVAA